MFVVYEDKLHFKLSDIDVMFVCIYALINKHIKTVKVVELKAAKY